MAPRNLAYQQIIGAMVAQLRGATRQLARLSDDGLVSIQQARQLNGNFFTIPPWAIDLRLRRRRPPLLCRRHRATETARQSHPRVPPARVEIVRSWLKKDWRRGRDLNPRYPLRYVRFRGGSFQPLTHLSAPGHREWSTGIQNRVVETPPGSGGSLNFTTASVHPAAG